jgi:NAD(P)-dependent dehydrogenase (short-subunit alcohol dehydrogenase family)
MSGFSGAKILITGAGSGIGAAAAARLAEAGATLILADRDEPALEAIGGDHRRLVGDVTDEALWAGADLIGLTHALVNAGIGDSGAIEALDFAAWRRVMAVNLDGAFLTLRAAMRAIRATGRGGAIVLTASAAGVKAEPGIAAYGASKAAVIHLAKIAAKEGADANIRVNAIAPGGVETPIWTSMPFFHELIEKTGSEAAAYAAMAKMATPLGRYAKPDEIAAQIAFLLSDEAAYITGACLVTDGGYTL